MSARVSTVEARLHRLIQPLLEEGHFLTQFRFRDHDDLGYGGSMCIKDAVRTTNYYGDNSVLGIGFGDLTRIEAGFEGWDHYDQETEWFKLGERIRETYGA